MRVRAIGKAFYEGSRVRPGQIVSVPAGFKAAWAEPVKLPTKEDDTSEAKPSTEKPKKKAPKKKAGK